MIQCIRQLDDGHSTWVQTHAGHSIAFNMLVILTLDLSTPNPCLLGYPKVVPYAKFEHLAIIQFLELCC